jgi:PAS domain S-box-containing protein
MAQNAHSTPRLTDRDADERVNAALVRAGIVLSTCDPNLRYTWLSQPMPGFALSDMLGRRDDELFPPDHAAALIAFKEAVLADGRGAVAELAISHRSIERVFEFRVEPLMVDGRPAGLWMAAIDTAARKSAERGLELSAQRAQALALATREGLLLHDGETVIEANEAFCRMFGISRDEAVGSDPMQFVAPQSRDFARMQAARRARGPDEIAGIRQDGTVFPAEVSVERFEYEGRTVRISHIRDLTEQKRAEMALRESEERYRALAAATREGVILHDGERIVEVNEIFCALHGTARERALGRSAYDFIAPEARVAALVAITSGTLEPYETIACREDGSTFPIEVAGRPIVYQGRLMRVATIRDLSERHVAETALRDSEERFRSFAEASRDVMWVVDAATGRVEYLSPSFELVWGETRDRAMRDAGRRLELVHPDDRSRVMEALAATLAGDAIEVEYRIVRADGAVRWIRDTGFPIRGGDRTVRRAAGLARDITRQKEHETRQRLMLGELNHRVKNTLATVQSIARQTLRYASSPALFQERFEDRLLALSKAHNLLTSKNWERVSLRALLKQELSPYGKGRVQLQEAQDVQLPPRSVVALGMALHELTTNAAKYGALSVETGSLSVTWDVSGTLLQRLRITWSERGGPPILSPPASQGFGSRLLERGITSELGGNVKLDFTPAGLDATIEIPLDPLRPL